MKNTYLFIISLFSSFFLSAQCPVDSIPVFAALDTFTNDSCYTNSFEINGVVLSQASGYTNPDTSYQLHDTVYAITEQWGVIDWTAYGHSDMPYRIGIWIDFNNNGFFDTTEYVGGNFSPTADPVLSSIISIPLDVNADTVKLRLIKVASTNALLPEASCGEMAYPYGEVEDYYIVINCAPPANVFYNSFEEICDQPAFSLFTFPDYGGVLWYADTLNPPIADSAWRNLFFLVPGGPAFGSTGFS